MHQLLHTLRIALVAFCFSLLITEASAQTQKLLSDLSAGTGSSDPKNFTAYNGKMYFLANGKLYQNAQVNGTANAVVVTTGIPAGQTLSGGPVLYNNKLYVISKGGSLYKLWSTTGGAATFIEDFSVSGGLSGVSAFNVQNGFLYFSLGSDRQSQGGASIAFRHNGTAGSKVELGNSDLGTGNQTSSTRVRTNFYLVQVLYLV